jgi:hypothetical protein
MLSAVTPIFATSFFTILHLPRRLPFSMDCVRHVDISNKKHRTDSCLIYDASVENFLVFGEEYCNQMDTEG